MSLETRARFPFRLKLTLLGAGLAVIPLAVVGWMLLDVNAHAVKVMSQENQLAILDDLARTVEESFADAQDGLDAIGRVLTDVEIDGPSTERLAANILSSQARLDHAGIYGRAGDLIDVLAEARGSEIVLPETLDEELRILAADEGVATGHATAGSPADPFPRVLLVIPLRVGSEVTGFVVTRLSLEALQSRVERLNELRFEGRPDSLFVVDEQHRVVAHPDRARATSLADAAQEPALITIEPGAVTERFQQSAEFSCGEEEMVGTIVGLGPLPWALVAQVPQRVAYASLFRMRWIVGITLVVVVLLALLTTFFVARRITQPIRALADFAGHLAARRFDKRIHVKTLDELGVLGTVMSQAAEDLQQSEVRIKEEVAIRSDLGRYLPHDLVEKVVAREQDMALGGGRREISVLFADVVAFTPLTDRLAAEEVVGLLNELFTILTEIVFRHGGTIDKFVGDCVMAVWGAATPCEEHAKAAAAAAEDMMRWIEAGNDGWKERFGVTIELAIGINSGDAVVGNIGSETRMEYTAIGDTVNVAARLESIARPSQILITKNTADALGNAFDVRELGPRKLTGRADDVLLFEVNA